MNQRCTKGEPQLTRSEPKQNRKWTKHFEKREKVEREILRPFCVKENSARGSPWPKMKKTWGGGVLNKSMGRKAVL